MPPAHTALRSLFLVAMHYGAQLQPEQLADVDAADTIGSVLRILNTAGLKASVLRGCHWDDVAGLRQAYPFMAIRQDGTWLIIIGTTAAPGGETAVMVLDPSQEHAGLITMSRAEFSASFGGTLILCSRQSKLTDELQPFGWRWFAPEILRHRRYLRDVAIAATMCNVIAFATPLFYHVIIDKVIPHHSYQTLYVVLLVFLVAMLFDGLFSYIRQYLMLFASNKIDARLASRTFKHLLGLPLPFFEAMPAGVLARHMQQTDRIRLFLTGRLFQTLLDTVALPLLLVLLVFYSAKLTLVVLGFSLAIAGVIGLLIPTFRAQLNQLYQAEGARQAHLVETIHGMRTVKSLALEPAKQQSWDEKVVAALRRHASVGRIGALANVLTTGLDKTMQLAVLGLGAVDVFDGHMSIGALVAFNMLSGRVSGPLVQIVGLISEYQETAISVKMLGNVMNHPPERDQSARGMRPTVTGRLRFDGVSFAYPGAVTPALDRVSFNVERGQVIGIVGRSGSGKTTITRMIQGIHSAQEGLIRLDGIDIRHIDLTHLRRSIGVVLQESFLFRGTIRDNIAAARPMASLAEVAEAAQMAGAEEFIERLPLSYDTFLEEGATNLSGGQRQRIAIARALLVRPRLLIFDEATSALDPESEAIVQQNLDRIARDRTMIIVSHRLASLAGADAILVLDRGKVVDFAPHTTLLHRCEVYSHLWDQQTHHLKSRALMAELVTACAP
jgi:ATP-binding cassette subfamily B protein